MRTFEVLGLGIIILVLAVMSLGALSNPAALAKFTQSQTSSLAQAPIGDSVVGAPTISANFIDQVLTRYGSPAAGTGQDLYDGGVQYTIDPAFALAVFMNESDFGQNGMAASTKSLGNLRCIDGYACLDGYAAFSSWQDGYRAFYQLISGPLYVKCGLTTPDSIMPRYAPYGDNNDPLHYSNVVKSAMSIWRSGKVALP